VGDLAREESAEVARRIFAVAIPGKKPDPKSWPAALLSAAATRAFEPECWPSRSTSFALIMALSSAVGVFVTAIVLDVRS